MTNTKKYAILKLNLRKGLEFEELVKAQVQINRTGGYITNGQNSKNFNRLCGVPIR